MAGEVIRKPRDGLVSRRIRHLSLRTLLYVLLIVGGLAYTFPILYMIRTSLIEKGDLYAIPPIVFPFPPAWDNYIDMWTNGPTAHWVKNSVIVTLISVVAETIVSTLVAYGFARCRFVGRDKVFLGVLATMMLPGAVTLIPRWLMFFHLGWIDTMWPLLVPRFFGTAFYIFILRQFFLSLPKELDEAAEIDGAGRLQVLFRLIVPLSVPAIATVGVFSFMNRWNDFLEPLIYLLHEENLTLAVGMRFFINRHETEYALLMAGGVLMTGPMIVAFFFAQKQFIRGIALTGIKG